jgi:hypothetical protein
MNDKYILDSNGHPQPCHDLHAWARWFETANSTRQIAKTEIGEVFVSTVFLALDHAWGDGPPLLWETMIFGGKHHQFQERYLTRDEALAGHEQAVALVRASLDK